MKNVTMKDIAQRLNVSTVTVSKALSDKDGVGSELRDKIRTVAVEMGYRFNSLAKSMKEGKSYNIGVIIAERYIKNDDDNAFYLKMYHNVVTAGGSKLLRDYGNCNNGSGKELFIPNIISDNKVDGIIIIGQMASDYLSVFKKVICLWYFLISMMKFWTWIL